MAASGAAKLAGADGQVAAFERYGYPQWFGVVTGGVELAGGLGLLAGGRRSTLTLVGGGLVGGTMAGAVATHLRPRDPPARAAPAAVLLGLVSVVSARAALIRHRREPASTDGGHDD